jgi:hypothetical protein
VGYRLALFAAALLIRCGAAAAQPYTADGITFSDELGGFTIQGASGHGTLEDPFVVIEEVTGPQTPVLVILGLTPAFHNRVGTQHLTGFALRKRVTNKTNFVWQSYNCELREVEESHSPYGDGLSFGQASDVWRPFPSDRFHTTRITDEPVDTVTYTDGEVKPGETVSLDMIITDTSPVERFMLFQSPDRVMAQDTSSPPAAGGAGGGEVATAMGLPARSASLHPLAREDGR